MLSGAPVRDAMTAPILGRVRGCAVGERRSGHLRVVQPDEGVQPAVTHRGRPTPERARLDWKAAVVRLLVLFWAGAVIAALVSEFQTVPHLPLFTALGTTVLLVAVTLAVTQDGVPDWRGDLVTERSDEEDETTDLLTDLPTFNHLQRRINDAFIRTRRLGKPFSLVLIDVNNLTAVNKEYGVGAGDAVLRHVAIAVDGTRRINDVVARLGDDEFGVLLVDCDEMGVKAFIDRLEDRLSRESAQAEVEGRTISLWAGICTGASTSSSQAADAQAVLEQAIENMNQAKSDRERRRRMWLSA